MAERQSSSMSGAEWAMLLTLSVLWGSSFFFFKVLVAQLPPFTVVLGRVGIAAVILNLFLMARRNPMSAKLPWGQFIVMGLLNNVVPFSLIVWGEIRVSSGIASILNATTPVFTVVAAHFLTRTERLTWARAVGVLFGVLGVVVLVGPDAIRGLTSESLPGEAACLLAALSYAFAGIYGRRFKGLAPLQVATGQITGATLVMVPIAAVTERFWTLPLPSGTVWGAFAGIAVLCTVLAYILYFRILATAGATNLLLVTFLLPISALLLGNLVLGEHIQPAAYLGMALIGVGLAAIDGRVIAAVRPRPATT
ncbi:Permease of the drug/metabolite transporter (DMT) superfamily protein [Beijerinckiaceae bacterium RH AL1]|nr:DMT family transporter [Beijerinckiaceae bacterium]VVB43471.1 Permease of the drug/metabolite transporter (DMT) superfamily protein [Beijerinckiaceae bacterium RH AL8]VVB43488.1 Permease of the drug/metabolite transporter (DMT) superfamily protein [Beijerinckiaceae bacterium RH CH11]VVC53859.1 Permease of the drug/metabolite transporter (DMT) superfamily protein [Beijerinckiaceae bacterium RH AL1]